MDLMKQKPSQLLLLCLLICLSVGLFTTEIYSSPPSIKYSASIPAQTQKTNSTARIPSSLQQLKMKQHQLLKNHQNYHKQKHKHSRSGTKGSPSTTKSSELAIDAGFHVSILDSYVNSSDNGSYFYIPKTDQGLGHHYSNLSVAIPVYGGGLFFPMLNSPNFYGYVGNPGFSLGFFYSPVKSTSDSASVIYLSICIGKLGSKIDQQSTIIYGIDDGNDVYLKPKISNDGVALPIWTANLANPLKSSNFSLFVASNGNLQLFDRNHNVTAWDIGLNITGSTMKMLDTGNLHIYDDSKHLVKWDTFSQNTDSLLPSQHLKHSGMFLVSSNSEFVARMELSGLVLYYNSVSDLRQIPYWAILVPNATDATKPPCAEVNSVSTAYWDTSTSSLALVPPHCMNNTHQTRVYSRHSFPSHLLKLENDGRLYPYYIDTTVGVVLRISDSLDAGRIADVPLRNASFMTLTFIDAPYNIWSSCDSLTACGGLSICTPNVEDTCQCVSSDLFVANYNKKGCRRKTSLSPNENIPTTVHTIEGASSISMLSGYWTNYNKTTEDECKSSCASTFACSGVLYNRNNSLCLPLTDDVTLLNVTSAAGTAISSNNFVTYIKVARSSGHTYTWVLSIKMILLIVSICLLIFVSILLLVVFIVPPMLEMQRSRKRWNVWDKQGDKESTLESICDMLPGRFSYNELYDATKSFSELLGSGGCGSVYTGILKDGRKVAVKRLFCISSKNQSKSFLTELAAISHTKHQNILRLLGFCFENSNMLLVYEYIERGSLDQWLFQGSKASETSKVINWANRYKIALGIARGLQYLHEDCPQPILHLDVKPQNILLNDEFVAKLADFGMSRFIQQDIAYATTGLRGTPGYIAPEWNSCGEVSKKCDVYSMGIVLLEIVAGRPTIIIDPSLSHGGGSNKCHLPTWAARECEEGRVMAIVDERIQISSSEKDQVQTMIKTAFWCIQEDPNLRPDISMVVKWLEETISVADPPYLRAASLRRTDSKPRQLLDIFSDSFYLNSHVAT